MSKPKADKAWLGNLDLRGRLLVFIGSCQSRYETHCISHLRRWWSEREIDHEIGAVRRAGLVEADQLDRLRLKLTMAGNNAARVARERAKAKAAKAAA